MLDDIINFYSNFNRNILRVLQASDLNMHCLPMPHKKGARLIWVRSFVLFKIVFQDANDYKNRMI